MPLKRGLFWIGVPVVIATTLWSPRRVVLYMGGDVPRFDRPLSRLPDRLGDLAYLYRATLLSVGILLMTTAALRVRARRGEIPPVSLTACFLPTYIAGIESNGHVGWASRCHSMGPVNLRDVMVDETYTCALALAMTIVAGAIAALLLGHRSRFGIPVPIVVAAIAASMAAPWLVLLHLVTL